jgi:hypothetical protein
MKRKSKKLLFHWPSASGKHILKSEIPPASAAWRFNFRAREVKVFH